MNIKRNDIIELVDDDAVICLDKPDSDLSVFKEVLFPQNIKFAVRNIIATATAYKFVVTALTGESKGKSYVIYGKPYYFKVIGNTLDSECNIEEE